jgi:hypothetical protein
MNGRYCIGYFSWDTLQKFGNPKVGDRKSAHQARFPSSPKNRSPNLVFSDYRQIRIIQTHRNSSESPNLVNPNNRIFGYLGHPNKTEFGDKSGS